MKSELVFQSSPWYILLCIVFGGLVAILLYYKLAKSKSNLILIILRGVFAALTAFLLLNPLIKTLKNIILKPQIVLAIDNSKSMTFGQKNNVDKLVDEIKRLKGKLEQKGFEVGLKSLDSEEIKPEMLNSANFFNTTKSNLSSLLSTINGNFEGQNLSDVILISDGISNEGVLPTYQKYNFNIHTLRTGDTTAKKDLVLLGITANKIANLGNKFKINVDINAYKYLGKTGTVTVKNASGNILAKKNFNIKTNEDFQSLEIELKADRVGKNRYMVDIEPLNDEFSKSNNHREFVVEVINGKVKVLLVAYAAHPDIKAIKSILDLNDLFELKVQNVQSTDPSKIGVEPFDLLILHQLPETSSGALVNALMLKKKPVLFVLGSKTNISMFNALQKTINISSKNNQYDKVNGVFNKNFNLFNYEPKSLELIQNLPPIIVPYGSYQLMAGSEVLLFQKIGNIVTDRPLLAMNLNSERKMAVLTGEGLWQWHMEEFSMNANNNVVNDLIGKVLQLISTKENNSKLKVYPIADVFDVDQKVVLQSEVYNGIYEKIYDQKIKLTVKSDHGESKTYEFVNQEDNSSFELSNLKEGLYNYTATTIVQGKAESCSGEFLITKTNLEAQNTVADHGMLMSLAKENHGVSADLLHADTILNAIDKKGAIDKIISNEVYEEIINWKWLLWIIVLFASSEWIFRKYNGLD